MDILAVLMRWTHITSMTFLVGGAIYVWLFLSPAMDSMPADLQAKLGDRIASRIRAWMIFVVVALIGSGLFNLLNKPMVPAGYHMWFGIKMLLALHIVAVSILMGKPGVTTAKRGRWAMSVAASGLLTLLLSAVLRAL